MITVPFIPQPHPGPVHTRFPRGELDHALGDRAAGLQGSQPPRRQMMPVESLEILVAHHPKSRLIHTLLQLRITYTTASVRASKREIFILLRGQKADLLD